MFRSFMCPHLAAATVHLLVQPDGGPTLSLFPSSQGAFQKAR